MQHFCSRLFVIVICCTAFAVFHGFVTRYDEIKDTKTLQSVPYESIQNAKEFGVHVAPAHKYEDYIRETHFNQTLLEGLWVTPIWEEVRINSLGVNTISYRSGNIWPQFNKSSFRCSKKNCSELGLTAEPYDYCHLVPKVTSIEMTFLDAFETCAKLGMRLCTLNDLENTKTKAAVWSSSPGCPRNMHWMATSDRSKTDCTFKETAGVRVDCCADNYRNARCPDVSEGVAPSFAIIVNGATIVTGGRARYGKRNFISGGPCDHMTEAQIEKLITTADRFYKFDTVVALNSHGSNGYYHTLIEMVPRLYVANQLIKMHNLTNVTYLVATQDYSINRDITKALDITDSQIVEVAKPISVFAKTALFLHTNSCGRSEQGSLLQFRNAMRQKYELELLQSQQSKEMNHIILIKRDCKKRCIINHDEVLASLKNHFPSEVFVVFDNADQTDNEIFERVDFNTTLLRTIHYFYGAKVVIAPHGAGLGNVIFSSLGIHVIEIITHPISSPCFVDLNEKVGNQHHIIMSEGTGPKNTVLNIELLTDLMENILIVDMK